MEELTIPQRFGAVLRSRREALNYSQDSFADAIGMHRAQYSALERGESNMTVVTLARLAYGLDTDIATLAKQAHL